MKSRPMGPVILFLLAAFAFLTLGTTGCGSGEGPAAALERNLQASETVTVRMTYDLTLGDADSVSSTYKFIQRPPDKRIDVQVTGEEPVSFVQSGERLFSCSPEVCTRLSEDETQPINGISVADALLLGFADLLRQQGITDSNVKALPNQQFAGVNAECFQITQVGTGQYCFSKADGALLRVSGTLGELPLSMEATELDYNVTDEDFALPAPLEP